MVTFHKIIHDCAKGDRAGWMSFVAEYTPLFTGLLTVYIGSELESEAGAAWGDTVGDLAAAGAARLQALSRHSEREFLADLRRLVLDRAWLTVPDETDEQRSGLPAAKARAVLEGLPLVHQQVVFLKLSGYTDEAVEKVLRITPGVAGQGFERLRSTDRFSKADWLRALKQAWSDKTASCPSPRMLIRMQDGQVTWYERDPVERHIVTCSHCLELWTAFAELRYWRREAHPLTAAEAERLLHTMQPETSTAKASLPTPGILKPRKG